MTMAQMALTAALWGVGLGLPAYTYYRIRRPWPRCKRRRKLHTFVGDEWVASPDGGMAIDRDDHTLYIYRFGE